MQELEGGKSVSRDIAEKVLVTLGWRRGGHRKRH